MKTCGDKAFSVCVPKLRDSLKSEVRTLETVYLIKNALKHIISNLLSILLKIFWILLDARDTRYCKAPYSI